MRTVWGIHRCVFLGFWSVNMTAPMPQSLYFLKTRAVPATLARDRTRHPEFEVSSWRFRPKKTISNLKDASMNNSMISFGSSVGGDGVKLALSTATRCRRYSLVIVRDSWKREECYPSSPAVAATVIDSEPSPSVTSLRAILSICVWRTVHSCSDLMSSLSCSVS